MISFILSSSLIKIYKAGSIIPLLNIGNNGFLIYFVSGNNLVPKPAIGIIALILTPQNLINYNFFVNMTSLF